MNLLGKLSWAAIPVHEPIIMGTVASVGAVILAALAWVTVKGILAVSLARMDHIGRSQAYRRHVSRACAGHACARLRGRNHDAHAAGSRRRRCAGISAARAFRPDFLGARHDHDLLRGHAAGDRTDEFRGAAAARRPRRGVSDDEFREPLADRVRHPADQRFARRRRVRKDRLGRLPAAQRAAILARRRRRLLSLVAANLGHRNLVDWRQFRHHDSEDAGSRHELHAHAGFLLDCARLESADRGCISGAYRALRDACCSTATSAFTSLRWTPAATR